MPKVSFSVPDGDYCKDCPHQEDFTVSEIDATTLGDLHPRYIRLIVANCHLFSEPIQGDALAEMGKCAACKRNMKD